MLRVLFEFEFFLNYDYLKLWRRLTILGEFANYFTHIAQFQFIWKTQMIRKVKVDSDSLNCSIAGRLELSR